MKILLHVEAVETNTMDKHGASPLLYDKETAMEENNYSTAKLLLDSVRIDVNLQYEDGFTAFSWVKRPVFKKRWTC